MSLAPSNLHDMSVWFNLRAIHDYSPTALLADPASERPGLGEFLRGFGVETAPDAMADPLDRLRVHLARSGGSGANASTKLSR